MILRLMCKRKDRWYNRLPWYFHVFPHISRRTSIHFFAVPTLSVMVKRLGRESPEATSDTQEFLIPCLLPTSAPSLSIITVNTFVKLGIFQVREFPEAARSTSRCSQACPCSPHCRLAFNFHGKTRFRYRFVRFDNKVCPLWTLITSPLSCEAHSLPV